MYVDNPALFILKAAQRLAETRQIKKESFCADAAQEHNYPFLLLGTRGSHRGAELDFFGCTATQAGNRKETLKYK